ncbi:NDP-sugar synthase [Candidatus Oleimmundimicrobium sp.]|uniref:NDP-sugar synthase n=1 Tax=Candidatus Oleimmundimicrobium sp. TaxID=3060597 RepID=UPI0027179C15|nr:NDP-sugar synthase [Candidatus Oleimmundimicrobium sp.]MDO8886583.1 NDP-sugar synthase [Candidatus Oleimmundimicrobium sp.]
MKAVILVGGQGTRLRPLTHTIPKAMLPLLNIPFLKYVFELLKRHGIQEIILSTGNFLDIFENYFGDGTKHDLKIRYVKEDEPLGTAGAIKNVEKYLDDDFFIVLNGDILTDLNITKLVEYHQSKKALATLALASVEDPTSYGLVPIDSKGKVVDFLEKPGWDKVVTNFINAGTYVFKSEVLNFIPEGMNYSFEKGVFPKMVEKEEKIYGFPSNAYWLDIGTPQKYLKAHHDILERQIKFNFKGKQVKPKVWIGKNCKISAEANIFGPVVIGDNCQIEANATIFGYTTIGDNCMIGSGATIGESIFFKACKVGSSSIIKKSILCNGIELGVKVNVEDMAIAEEEKISLVDSSYNLAKKERLNDRT